MFGFGLNRMVRLGSNSNHVVRVPEVSLPTATGITDNSATVGATLDCKGLATTWSIEYGATTAYGSTQAGGTTSVNGAKTVDLVSLTPNVLLHWRFKAVNAEGTAYSTDQTLTPVVPTADLVQRLFKADQPVSQNLGTKAIDYSAAPVNADIWQTCLYPTALYELALNESIAIDWTTDGVKAEFVASIKTGNTISDLILGATTNHGIRIYTNQIRIYGFKADGTTIADITFTSITTTANDTFSRYRITKSGVNIIVEKTIPSDVNFTDAGKLSQTRDVSSFTLGSQTFTKLKPTGGVCYLNLNGYKWAFSEGPDTRHAFSYNSSKRATIGADGQFSLLQNAYCHNAIYGYSSVYYDYSTYKRNSMLAYDENGNPSVSYHAAFFTRYIAREYPAAKSFGRGYAVKLNNSMLAYDQSNTFFDSGNAAIAVYKNTLPSTLNSKIFFDHTNGNELLIYSQAKTLRRPINTANKKGLIVGDSMAADNYWWPVILSNFCGIQRTTKSFSGRTLSTNIQTDLTAQVNATPTLISDKDFIIIEGGFNDFVANISEATFASGIASLYAYIRAQNATATIFVCGPYNWGNPIADGSVANTAGMTRNSMRQAMQDLVNSNSNAYYFDWSLAGVGQADLESAGLHLSSNVGAYNIAKLMYDKIITIY